MLKIRPDQTPSFEASAIDNFVQRAVSHLRTELPDHVRALSDQQLDTWVRDVMMRGEAFGLRSEKQVICMLDSEVLLGPKFYDDPKHRWARTIVTSDKLHPDDKSRVLLATACSVSRGQGAQ